MGATNDPKLELPEQHYTSEQIRRGTRAENRYRTKRRSKGNRAFFEHQRKEQYNRETIAAQLHVLKTRDPEDPMYRNVYNGLVAKYGEQIKAMIEAEVG